MSPPQNKKIRPENRIIQVPVARRNKFRPCLNSFTIPQVCAADAPSHELVYMPAPCPHSHSFDTSVTNESCSSEDFCTEETCQNSRICSETQPKFCSQGFKDEIDPECPCLEDQTGKPCEIQEEKTSDLNISEPMLDIAVCPNAATQTPCCELNKPELTSELADVSTAGDREIAKCHTVEKSSVILPAPEPGLKTPVKPCTGCPSSEKMRSDACASVCQPAEVTCACHFPPAFSQFGCTGNINGNCGCDQ